MSWSLRPSRIFIGSSLSATAMTGLYFSTRRPLRLDSPDSTPDKTLSFPKNMLFSQTLTVTNVEQLNHDTKRITFKLPGGTNEISGVGPGGAILTQHTPEGGWFPVFRPYTPVNDLDQRGILQLVVKKYPEGRASGHLHALQPGQGLTVRGPIPSYTWKPSAEPRDLLLIAGGAGITPIYSLAKGILSDPSDNTRMKILWGVNGPDDIVLLNELEALEKQYPERIGVTYYISGPEDKIDEKFSHCADKYQKGRISKSVLQEAIASVSKDGAWGDMQGKKVFLCGPPPMEQGLAGKNGVLSELGIEKKAVQLF